MGKARRRVGLSGLVVGLALAVGGTAWGQAEASRAKDSQNSPQEKEPGASFLENFYLDIAPEYEVGKFGTKLKSDFLYLPATLGYDHAGFVASLEVPYEVERSRVGVFVIGGRTVRTSGAKKGKIMTEAGLGDIYLDAGYYIFERAGLWPSLLLEGEVKFPTANDHNGLGTGAYDKAIRASSSAKYFDHLLLYAEIAYDWIGQPEEIPVSVQEFHDSIYWSASAGYAFSRSNELWARIDANTRITDGTPPYELFSIEWDHFFANESKLYLSLGFGLTNSAPGIALTLGYKFWF